MIIQTCPKCGADLEHMVFATYPPIPAWRCPKCGWRHEQREEIKRVPFKPRQKEGNAGTNGPTVYELQILANQVTIMGVLAVIFPEKGDMEILQNMLLCAKNTQAILTREPPKDN